MSKRKNQNSILVLATLGVYLGLVLAGATPQVLAQAAMAREFQIKDEIEVKSNLDDNPDGEIAEFFDINLDKAVGEFIGDLRRLGRRGKYKSELRQTFSTSCVHSFCSIEISGVSTGFTRGNQDSETAKALWTLHYKIDKAEQRRLSKLLFIDFPSTPVACKEIGLDLVLSPKALIITFEFTRKSSQNALGYAEILNREFHTRSTEPRGLLAKRIYENSKALTNNQRVLVITRLPRAGLDALLAKDAK